VTIFTCATMFAGGSCIHAPAAANTRCHRPRVYFSFSFNSKLTNRIAATISSPTSTSAWTESVSDLAHRQSHHLLADAAVQRQKLPLERGAGSITEEIRDHFLRA
jgi:hypothetical protein